MARGLCLPEGRDSLIAPIFLSAPAVNILQAPVGGLTPLNKDHTSAFLFDGWLGNHRARLLVLARDVADHPRQKKLFDKL
jgi:hypothetical protein